MSPTTKRPEMAPTQFIGAVEDRWGMYSDRSEDYTTDSPIGFGASSIVYSASYKPQDSSQSSGSRFTSSSFAIALQRETTLMSLSKHPNVLRVHGSWMDGHKLFIALRLMNKGSAANIMHYGWPARLEEDVIRCILHQALLGLNYLHVNSLFIATSRHTLKTRDGKMEIFRWYTMLDGARADSGEKTMTPLQIYDDLGQPPRSRESPQKEHRIQEASPTLNRDGGTYKYSRAFQEMVESFMVKDPSYRPNAEQPLQTQFFKGAKKPSYLIATILKNLPPLAYRQERRVVASNQTFRSIGSWDFATTIHSPASVQHRRRLLDEQGDDVIFEMETEWDRENGRRSENTDHPSAVSWNEPERPVSVEEEPELETDLVPSSVSSSPSGSEFESTSTSTSPEIDLFTWPLSIHGDAEPKTIQPVKEIPTPSGLIARMPSSSSVKAKPDISASPFRTGLWKKMKSNIRRPSSYYNGTKTFKAKS
ncbi:uncharacterized protein BT62DRAFT_924924 [Guyanagaster necrorhizus]|uniref:Protein kinase domain-containing protein n=1 Tax=Guyanagaster necrorhizus TaxID=856835 RepID=A0A9P7VDV7_9AGAR|nr:uncharacterized protein BT62DRAFT_924924 [Guyanagaster necrorhizus MCA 3950]KAG7439096.1 hypothetical protein BT62DRAFT_924924 [Guyanagaster necrorhizus MCA 3950]